MDDRKLTPAEEKRKTKFKALSAELEQQGYQKTDLCFSVTKANVLAVAVTFPIFIAGILLFFWKNGGSNSFFLSGWRFLLFLITFLAGIAVHELIHGITWSIFAKKGFKAIDFGFMAKYLTPYCTCGEPLPFWSYATGILMPTLILGVGVYLVGLFAESYAWALWGLLNIFAGGGDLAVLWRIRKRRKSLLLDHPYQVGCVVFDKN